MRSLPASPGVLKVARRVVWFQDPEDALSDPARFLAYVMTYGTAEDLESLREAVTLDDYREALEHAPPGVFDPRSWAYWNQRCGRWPTPQLPRRRAVLEDSEVAESR